MDNMQQYKAKCSVALISCSELSDKNGVVTFIENFTRLQNSFKERGFKIEGVYGSDLHTNENVKQEKVAPSKIFRWKQIIRSSIKNTWLGALFLIYFSYILRAKRAYGKYLQHGRCDIVIFQDIFCYYVACKDINFHEKSIVIFHSGENVLDQIKMLFPGACRSFAKRYIEHVLDRSLKQANKVVTLSNEYRIKLEQKYGSGRFCTIYNTAYLHPNLIDVNSADQPTRFGDKLNLVSVGSAQYRKGYDILISAISLLNSEAREKIILHIAGDGDQLNFLKKLVEYHGLKNQIIFYGKISEPSIIYNIADIFCLPSRDEGLSISLLEAMSVGIPILATPVGSIDEILEPGEYIRVGVDDESMKDALMSVLNNEYDLKNLGIVARTIFENILSNKKFIENYSQLMIDACQDNN